MSLLENAAHVESLTVLSRFRGDFYSCLPARADALFELTDALLCADGPVKTLVDLSLAPEMRRGHGALYGALNHGRLDVARLRRTVAGLPLPRAADGRIVLACDVSNWLRPDAATSPDRLFCHTYGRGKGSAQMIPGWPYSIVAALEPGRTSWTALLDAIRLGPGDDETTVTAAQLREMVERLRAAGHHKDGDLPILIVLDAGYDVTRLAFLLADLPVELLGRMRSDRVLHFPPPPQPPGKAGRKPRHGAEFKFTDESTWPAPAHTTISATSRYGQATARSGPAAPPAEPTLGLGRPPRRRPPGHLRHGHPLAGRPPARGPRPQTRVAVVVGHRRHGRGRGPALAVVPAKVRSRTHLPAAQTDPGMDHTQNPRTRRRRPLDLARHHRPHPTPPRPAPGRRPPQALGTPRQARPPHPRPRPPGISPPAPEDTPTGQRTETRESRPRPARRLKNHPPRTPTPRRKTRQNRHARGSAERSKQLKRQAKGPARINLLFWCLML